MLAIRLVYFALSRGIVSFGFLAILVGYTFAQETLDSQGRFVSIGILTKKSYVNDDLGLELKFPTTSVTKGADDLQRAAKDVADSLSKGTTNNDRGLLKQANSTVILLTVYPSKQSSFLSMAVAKANDTSIESSIRSTIDLLTKSGQYKLSSETKSVRLSGESIFFFTVTKIGSPTETKWRLYTLRRNGFDITIGLVYSSVEEMVELESIINSIKFSRS